MAEPPPGVLTRLSEADAQIILAAVDDAFQSTLHGRYGGGVLAILKRGGATLSEQPLRDIPVGLDAAVILELTLRPEAPGGVGLPGGAAAPAAPAGPAFADSTAVAVTAVGVITMLAPPDHGAGDVHVLTEIFDDRDPNEPADSGSLSTGLLLSQEPQGVAGQMPGRGVYVVRSDASEQASDASARQGQRGWLPLQPRGKVNRGAGLGSNGHRRHPTPELVAPVARALLKHVADHVAGAGVLQGQLDRLVIGLQTGEFAPL